MTSYDYLSESAALGDPSPGSLLSVRALRLVLGQDQLLEDVTFTVGSGEVVGLVGESGSGKTLTGLSILGLAPPGARLGGSVKFEGEEILGANREELRKVRGHEIAMIFQEPRASLNPSIQIGRQIVDVIRVHDGAMSKAQARQVALSLLRQVGIPNPRASFSSYAHELSGGMCQRVMIAMALSGNPKLLIADEPTTALDVTVQAQIVSLLQSISYDVGLSILLITHNLAVVSEMCNRIVTMYCGQVVNAGRTEQVITEPRHPYTRALVVAASLDLALEGELVEEAEMLGQPAVASNPPSGCRYHPRCAFAEARCESTSPQLLHLAGAGETRCLRAGELQLRVRRR
jgi:peptide/nickel transport system ATP-binding protein